VNLKKTIRLTVPVLLLSAVVSAQNGITLTNVPAANPKIPGVTSSNVLSPELMEVVVGQGSIRLENTSALTSYYGYDNDLLSATPGVPRMIPAPGALPSTQAKIEATKTEPDKNTYLVLQQANGADPHYDYGTHFLFQGHEVGVGGQGYITRINLDADAAHRITLLATTDTNGHTLPVIDGSSWYPFSERLLFTAELGNAGGVWQATADYPSSVEPLLGVMGQGGYEGIQSDNHGNLIIVEDVGGSAGTLYPNAKRPNSFVYKFVPYNTSYLTSGGKLYALQVMSKAHSGSIIFGSNGADADIKSQDEKDLHTYGLTFQTNWVLLHDTATQGFNPFDANALAKAGLATPFKRPENGQFRPGSNFSEFVFDETGDTNAQTEAGSDYGGFGAVYRLKLASNGTGTLVLAYNGDVTHTGFDNCAFWTADTIVFVEDGSDPLHAARNALDSAYLLDLNVDYSQGAQPIRILAEGRDPSATLDSGFSGMAGFQNEGDNEITGFHVSDGDASVRGLIGTQAPTPFKHGWRVFYTQQHGDNNTWEILPVDAHDNGRDD
jgi:hypothetical protein